MAHTVPSDVVRFIDGVFPHAQKQQEGKSDSYALDHEKSGELAAVLALLDQIPDHLFRLEPPAFAELAVARAVIEDQLAKWQTQHKGQVAGCGFGDLNPVTLIRRALSKCPDEAPLGSTSGLEFVADAALREALRLDLASAEGALVHAEWKAATILAGAVIEALLLDALERRTPDEIANACKKVESRDSQWKSPKIESLSTWSLHQYQEVARQLGIIKDGARALCNEAREFRNLIHPGRTKLKGMTCSKGTAYTALAAVSLVIDDLTSAKT